MIKGQVSELVLPALLGMWNYLSVMEHYMGFEREKIKQIYKIIIFCALLILAIIYIKEVLAMIKVFFGILMPFILGGVIAFVLNIPLCGIENKILNKWNGKLADKLKRPVSILLSILFVTLIIIIVIMTVVPQLASAITELGKKVPTAMNNLIVYLNELSVKYPQIEDYVADIQSYKFDWNSITSAVANILKNGVSNLLTSTVAVASGIIGGLMNAIIGFIFAIYLLSQKEAISVAIKKVMKTYLKPEKNDIILKISKLLYVNFSNFITGQCVEALILGSLFVVSMFLFRLPYALMIGILIAFTALIPIVGAFVGCVVGVFLIFVDSPSKVIVFLILFFVLQQIEGNVIYPKVVGNKVGLPSILVLMAVTIGGSLFGVAGMLVFIPLVSTVYTLINENMMARSIQHKNTKIKSNNKSADDEISNNEIQTNIILKDEILKDEFQNDETSNNKIINEKTMSNKSSNNKSSNRKLSKNKSHK